MRHFIVTGNQVHNPKKGRYTFKFSVVCRDLKRALELAEEVYPECTIMTIADQGIIDKVEV